ncbi:MAG: TonB-dependent receptor [Brevundimonas sp.]|nr:TonB-dependent receptor [Brevundimonas sp.]
MTCATTNSLLALTALVATGLSVPARAQTPQNSDVPADQLEELVVTARKRAERLQEVPSSGIALDTQTLRDLAVGDGRSLIAQVPGALVIDTGPSFDNEIIIRGAGAGRQTNAEVAAGLYRNGAFIAGGNLGGRNFNTMDFFDAERVEVMRGPQGALFGRNAVGGAINIISVRPKLHREFDLRGSYGEKESAQISAVANIPIGPNFATRVGFLHKSQNEGFYINSTGEVLDASEFNGGRLGFLYQQSDELQVRFTLDYFEETGPSFAVFFYNKVGGQDPFRRNFRWPSEFERSELTGILEVDYEMPWAILSSVTYLRDRDAMRRDEVSTSLFFPPPPTTVGLNFRAVQTDDFQRFGQELRLASRQDQALTWLVGAEYTQLNDYTTTQNLGAIAAQLNNTNRATSDDVSWSLFGGLEYDVSERMSLSTEMRLNNDSKKITLDIDRFRAGTGAPIKIVRPFSDSWSNSAWVLAATYEATSNASIYARIAKAYRPGGFNDDPGGTDNTFSVAYDQEETLAYELGIKSEWLNRRLRFNLAVFSSETLGLLENQSQFSTTQARTVRYITNIGDITHRGLEAEVQGLFLLPSLDARLRLSLAGAKNYSRYETGPNSGREVSRIRPDTLSANAAATFNASGRFQPFIRASYRGEWGGLQNTSLLRPQDDIVNLDVSAGFRTDAWSVTLRVRNASDEVYDLDRLTSNTPGVEAYRRNLPRTTSLEFSYEF